MAETFVSSKISGIIAILEQYVYVKNYIDALGRNGIVQAKTFA